MKQRQDRILKMVIVLLSLDWNFFCSNGWTLSMPGMWGQLVCGDWLPSGSSINLPTRSFEFRHSVSGS